MLEFLSRPISLSPVSLPQMLSGRFPLFALLAGLCWLGRGALLIGQRFGREPTYPFQHNTLGVLLDRDALTMPVSFAAYLITSLALIAFADRMPAYREGWQRAAANLAFAGALAEAAGLVGLLYAHLREFAGFPAIAVWIAENGSVALSVAALLIGFGALRVHNPPERRAARCIAVFGLLTLSLARLLGVLAFIPGIGFLLYGPVVLLLIPEMALSFVSSFLSGPLWLGAALLIAVGDKTLLSPVRTAPRTNV